MMDAQKPLVEHLKDRAEKSLRLDHPNEVTAPWKIDTVSAPALDGYKSQTMEITEKKIDIPALNEAIEYIRKKIYMLRRMTKNTTNLENEHSHFLYLAVNGTFEIQNKTVLDHIWAETFNDEIIPEFLEDFVR